MIDNHGWSITFAVLSVIVIVLTPFAIESDKSTNVALTPMLIIGDCLMVSCIYLTRKGTGLDSPIPTGEDRP